jgi:hypothetical protein
MIRALCLFAVLFAGAAEAQSIRVASGEHEGFTRLVLRLPGDGRYDLDFTDRRVEIDVPDEDVRFDTSGVFRRIGQSRILSVAQAPEAAVLTVELACNCDVRHFVEGRYLVVDVTDDPPEPDLTLPTVFGSMPYRFSTGITRPHQATARQPNDIEHETPNRPQQGFARVPNAAQDRLVAQLDRAATLGLVDPTTPDTPLSEMTASERDRQQPVPGSPDTLVPSEVGLRIASSVDAALAERVSQGDYFAEEQTCPEDHVLDLANWATDRPFAAQLAHARAALFGEFDRIKPDAAEELARLLLAFGFGAEARRVAQLIPDDRSALLTELSHLMDGDAIVQPSNLTSLSQCGGAGPIFAVLSDPAFAGMVDKEDTFHAFTKLPLHMRRHLAPRLSQAFLDINDVSTADALIRATSRGPLPPDPGVQRAESNVAERRGDERRAQELREEVVASGSEDSPRALISLINSALKDGTPTPVGTSDLAAAYALEHRGSPLSDILLRSQAFALSLDGDFDMAFQVLSGLEKQNPTFEALETATPVYDLLTAYASDLTFLSHVLAPRYLPPEELGTQSRVLIAQRLIDLGFAAEADLVLGDDAALTEPEHRRLRAAIALELDAPREAAADLLALSEKQDHSMRAAALAAEGDFDAAATLYRAADMVREAERMLWLAGAGPEDLTSEAATEYAAIVDATADLIRPASFPADLGPLATARALAAESEEARRALDDLRAVLARAAENTELDKPSSTPVN